MASYYESTKTANIIVSYVCSHCHTVIARQGILHVLGRANAKKNASAAAEKGFSDAVYAIEHACEKPFLLCKAYDFESEVSRDSFVIFSFRNFEHSCPFCGGKELWQGSSFKGLELDGPDWSGKMRVQTFKGVPQDSRPYLIKSGDDLTAWQERILIQQKIQFDRSRVEKDSEYEAAKAKLDDFAKQIADIDAAKSNLGKEAKVLKAKIDAMTEDAKKFSLFSAERRNASKEIKVLQKQYDALEREDSGNLFTLNNRKADLAKQKKNLMIQYPGLIGEYNLLKSDDKGLIMGFRMD